MAVHVAKFLAGLRSMENGRKYGFHVDKEKYDPILWLSSELCSQAFKSLVLYSSKYWPCGGKYYLC